MRLPLPALLAVPLPPGVARWPAPGEAVVSPAVAADLGADQRYMFGRIAGIIAPQGLEVPRERRVYLRPAQAAFDPREMRPAAGFGSPNDGSFVGEGSLYAAPLLQVQLLVLSALVAPALVALGLAAGVDG